MAEKVKMSVHAFLKNTLLFTLGILMLGACKKDKENEIPLPTILSFMASPMSTSSGESVILSWSVDNAETIQIDNGIGLISGMEISITPFSTTTYKLIATNEAGIDSAKVTVTVSPNPNTLIVSIDPVITINPNAQKLLGITFDSRSSLNYAAGKTAGYHDPVTGNLLSELQPLFDRIPFTTLRYPGNAVLFNWNWKYSIGPFNNRTPQLLAPNVTEKLKFGFDEFMSMVESCGLSSSEVQIMLNIYPIEGEVNAAQSAADWVEYCNSPNDGGNTGGGTDWAAERSKNGHDAPYNIKIWNIGNEPWRPEEFNFDETQYIHLALPIINAMKQIDPNLKITLPFVGNSNSPWNTGILNSTSLEGKFWGISPHFFYDEETGTNNPNIEQDEVSLKAFEAITKSKGLALIIGDHSHDAPSGDADKGFRWQGALATLDFITMLSQISNIDRANYWIYGNTLGAWHPIRKNNNGTFTFMAAAEVYELLSTMILDKSIHSTIATGSSINPTNVRSSAFQSNDGKSVSIVVVNIDKSAVHNAALPILSGYSFSTATLITGNLMDDHFTKTQVALQEDQTFKIPPASALFIQYVTN